MPRKGHWEPSDTLKPVPQTLRTPIKPYRAKSSFWGLTLKVRTTIIKGMTISPTEAAKVLGSIGGKARGPCKSRPGVARAYWDSPAGLDMRQKMREARTGKPCPKRAHAVDKPN